MNGIMWKAITKTIVRNLLAGLVLTLTLVAGTSPTVATSSVATEVFEKIRDRLGLMQPVAAWKAKRNLPVEDIEREKIVLQSSTSKAEAAGIDGPSVKVFFEEQIAAAKEIQSCWMERWAEDTSETPQTVPDLINEIRPLLIQLGAEILKNIALALRDSKDRPFDADSEAAFIATIDIDCLSEESKRRIYRALATVRLKE